MFKRVEKILRLGRVDRLLMTDEEWQISSQSGVVNEILKASGEVGVSARERKMKEHWKRGIIVPFYKGIYDPP